MIGGIQTSTGGPGRIVVIDEPDVLRSRYGFSVLRNVEEKHLFIKLYSDEECKALEDEDFGPEEEEEEADTEMFHEDESSKKDYVRETDASSDGARDGADASEWEADKYIPIFPHIILLKF
ncbi:uncharacterized protein MONOS_15668 [Monocercomonoides exilis]|uniref:uncharacterized protein n=1 Tax=Monocercomonoides exilis TaxID=2049356 RepID=UPI003559E6A6|nr:hypothetical protein MONOS_15668 [Monocercomonoides exilis]|eukprot:MONOS_15668.1-p1 / transcript=MONOS_15668.1 / gene=MONOS_15668 / organism=Monocercomonoides_exilis_PA203 / gene_product=unspecified product / transcript_product=unspecified product / location=Mono_scaffold01303:6313-7592(+) / protein_length=121 / sequence_SO=supercontig / SO=protein_coding / is_pseudo=false